jgi:hypothetical protein
MEHPSIFPCPDGIMAGTLRVIGVQSISFNTRVSTYQADALGEDLLVETWPTVMNGSRELKAHAPSPAVAPIERPGA